MITAALIVVVITSADTHSINTLTQREEKVNTILKANKEKMQSSQIFDNEINNDNLIKIINKVTEEFKDDLNHQYLLSNTKRDKNKSFYKSFVKPDWLKLHKKERGLSDELNEVKENKFYEDSPSQPNDFSKVYLILNPGSALTSSDVRDLTKVVSSLFSKSEHNKNAKYKQDDKTLTHDRGFLMGDERRRFKESKEKFAKDSIERDYKPKRVRSDYGGGGRTAIPYIRHRGDIYERD